MYLNGIIDEAFCLSTLDIYGGEASILAELRIDDAAVLGGGVSIDESLVQLRISINETLFQQIWLIHQVLINRLGLTSNHLLNFVEQHLVLQIHCAESFGESSVVVVGGWLQIANGTTNQSWDGEIMGT